MVHARATDIQELLRHHWQEMSGNQSPERIKIPSTNTSLPTSSHAPSALKSNALQSRITSVLSASYADLEIRDALTTLDGRQIRNTADTRRNLRLEAQQELIECNGDVIRDFGSVAQVCRNAHICQNLLTFKQQLKRVGAAIADLNKSCVAMRSHIAVASRETGPCLEESLAMTAQKRQTETKQQLLEAFTTHFTLSDDEVVALTSTAEPVTDAFFSALVRVKKIHDDSQLLLGSEDQQLGLEILDRSSKQLNGAFQKLFRWTQRELRTLDLENPQLSNAVRRALRVLAERPALFQSCLDFFAESRDHVLSEAFHAALTGGSAQQQAAGPALGKAIELSAHDPLRYVSDMLAWAHAATVGEHEALQILFISDADEISKNIKASREREPWLQMNTSTDEDSVAAFDGKQALNDLVDRDMAGVLRQLRQRIEQIIQSHEDATLAYQISNMITFYCSIFTTALGQGSGIVQTLQPVTQKAFEQFRTTMRDHIANIHSDMTAASSDLSPPEFFVEALQTLIGLMKSYDTSLASVKAGREGPGFQPVLDEALDPYLAGCENIAKKLASPRSEILAMNCMIMAKSTLKGHAFTEGRVSKIEQGTRQLSEQLVQTVHTWFLTESGLKPLIQSLEPFTSTGVSGQEQEIRRLSVLQPEQLMNVAQQLDGFLPGAMEDARAFIGQLEDGRLVGEICDKAADAFIEEFETAEGLLAALDEANMAGRTQNGLDEEEGEPLLKDLFPRTSVEMKVLLS